MRDLSREIVCAIIVKAREFQAKVAVTDPDSGSNPTDEDDRGVLEDHADDPTLAELQRLIDDLNVDEAAELVALFWIGRGDYTAQELDAARAEALRQDRQSTPRYLVSQPQLADFLSEGLAAFGLDCLETEIEHL